MIHRCGRSVFLCVVFFLLATNLLASQPEPVSSPPVNSGETELRVIKLPLDPQRASHRILQSQSEYLAHTPRHLIQHDDPDFVAPEFREPTWQTGPQWSEPHDLASLDVLEGILAADEVLTVMNPKHGIMVFQYAINGELHEIPYGTSFIWNPAYYGIDAEEITFRIITLEPVEIQYAITSQLDKKSLSKATTQTLFTDSFSTPASEDNWQLWDDNDLSGYDYWGHSSLVTCARWVGEFENFLYCAGHTDSPVVFGACAYDNNMTAYAWSNTILDVEPYSSITLSFDYNITSIDSGTAPGVWHDYFEVFITDYIEYDHISMFKTDAFTGIQHKDLTWVSPPQRVRILFLFSSDNNMNGYGASLDNVALTGVCPTPSAPALLEPTNGSTNTPRPTTLSWNPVAGISYNVYLGTSPTNMTLQGSTDVGTYAVNPPDMNSTYYWRVEAVNGCGNTTSSATWSFTTCPPIEAPSLSSPADLTHYVPTTVTLSWNPVPDATSYTVRCAGFTDVFGGMYIWLPDVVTTETSCELSGLTQNREYKWYVIAQNHCGSTHDSPERTFYTETCPAQSGPSLGSPSDDALVDSSVTLSWSTASGAEQYRVYLGTDPDNLVLRRITSWTSWSVSYLSPGTTYYWMVTAENICGNTGSSVIRSFTTICPSQPAPSLLSPANGASDLNTQVQLQWNAVSYVHHYNVYCGTDPTDLTFIVQNQSYDRNHTVTGLLEDTTYYWKIEAVNVCGNIGTSQTWHFKTACTIPPAPGLVSPTNGSSHPEGPITLEWTPLDIPGLSYRIYCGNSPSDMTLVGSTSGMNTFTINGLTGGSDYYWKVESVSHCGSINASDTLQFTLECPAQTAPPLVAPNNGATDQPVHLNLEWTPVDGAVTYAVYLGQDNSPPVLLGNTVSNQYPVGGLDYFTDYQWYVVAENHCENTGTSETWHFRTLCPDQEAPIPVSPVNGAEINDTNTVLSWMTAAGADHYNVYLGTDGAPALIGSTADTTMHLSDIPFDSTLVWYVEAVNICGNTGTGETWSFSTGTPAQLTDIQITGPADVPENSGAQYTCTATFSDGSHIDVTGSCQWVVLSASASISTDGVLTTGEVNADTGCAVLAYFTHDGRLLTDRKSVMITNTAQPDTTAPYPPTNLRLVETSPEHVTLAFDRARDNDQGSGIRQYMVQRNAIPVATTRETLYEDPGVVVHATYTYTVLAEDWAGNISDPSNAITATVPDEADLLPTAPMNLTAHRVPQGIQLQWDLSNMSDNSDIHYLVSRTMIGTKSAYTITTRETVYLDTSIMTGSTYEYTVWAVSESDRYSPPSRITIQAMDDPGDYVAVFPHLANGPGWWTGYALVNPNAEPVDYQFEFLSEGGELVATIPIAEPLMPNGKIKGLAEDLFNGTIPESIKWWRVRSAQPLEGFQLFGRPSDNGETECMGGVMLIRNGARRLLFPVILSDEDNWTGIALVNPSPDSTATFTVTAYGRNGRKLAESDAGHLPPWGQRVDLVGHHFPDGSLPDFTDFILVEADMPLMGLEVFGDKRHVDLSVLPALDRLEPTSKRAQSISKTSMETTTLSHLYLLGNCDPQTQHDLSVTMVNAGDQPVVVQLSTLNGNEQTNRSLYSIPKHGHVIFNADESPLVDMLDSPIQIRSDRPLAIVKRYGTLQGDGRDVRLPVTRGTEQLAISHIASSTQCWTNTLFVANLSADANNLQFTCYSTNGEVIGVRDIVLDPHGTIWGELHQWFDDTTIQKTGWMSITATAPISGHYVFTTTGGTCAAGFTAE